MLNMRIKLSTPKDIAKKNGISVQAVFKWIETDKITGYTIPSKRSRERVFINPDEKQRDPRSTNWNKMLRSLDRLAGAESRDLGFQEALGFIMPELYYTSTPEEFADKLADLIENAISNGNALSIPRDFIYEGYSVVTVPSKNLIKGKEMWTPFAVITSLIDNKRELLKGEKMIKNETDAIFASAKLARDAICEYGGTVSEKTATKDIDLSSTLPYM